MSKRYCGCEGIGALPNGFPDITRFFREGMHFARAVVPRISESRGFNHNRNSLTMDLLS